MAPLDDNHLPNKINTCFKHDLSFQGNFGIVRKGGWERMPGWTVPVAIKLPKESEMRTEEDRKNFEEEIRHMSMCSKHKNIVEVYGFVQSKW